MFDIVFYRLPDGTAPVEAFLDELEPKMRAKALYGLSILKEYGNELREPYSKPVGNGLFELRIKFSSDITRIFYFFFAGNQIILTNGFVKKTVKTPRGEIDRARRYRDDHERRHCHE